jgi:hypothetical protein
MKKLGFSIVVLLFSIVAIQAQIVEVNKSDKEDKLYVKVKDEAKPTIYVDGKKFDFPMDLIDQNRIETISVFNGDKAIELYNEPNGVILIKTKITDEKVVIGFKSKVDLSNDSKNKPVVILDGKIVSQEVMDKLSPDSIKSINVVKGEKALKEYNAPNGVIIITSKKK